MVELSISTKYYTAEVRGAALQPRRCSAALAVLTPATQVTLADHDALSAENVPGSEPGQAAFGVILVFDAREVRYSVGRSGHLAHGAPRRLGQAGSLERLLEAYTRHNLQASGDELCLLVAFAPGEGAPTAVSSSRPAALEWALANGFELVELAEQGT